MSALRTLSLYARLRLRQAPQTILRSPVALSGDRWSEPRGPAAINNSRLRQRSVNVNFILWLIVGGIVGWLASLVMRTDGQQGILLNVIVGIIGAFIGGWLISPLVGVGTINEGFSIGSVLVSLVGAIILLAIVNLFRRGRVR
jgi:uncharacterized membrane protein YeaQ/YmgE (transglycosylase-associated protein family)